MTIAIIIIIIIIIAAAAASRRTVVTVSSLNEGLTVVRWLDALLHTGIWSIEQTAQFELSPGRMVCAEPFWGGVARLPQKQRGIKVGLVVDISATTLVAAFPDDAYSPENMLRGEVKAFQEVCAAGKLSLSQKHMPHTTLWEEVEGMCKGYDNSLGDGYAEAVIYRPVYKAVAYRSAVRGSKAYAKKLARHMGLPIVPIP